MQIYNSAFETNFGLTSWTAMKYCYMVPTGSINDPDLCASQHEAVKCGFEWKSSSTTV